MVYIYTIMHNFNIHITLNNLEKRRIITEDLTHYSKQNKQIDFNE